MRATLPRYIITSILFLSISTAEHTPSEPAPPQSTSIPKTAVAPSLVGSCPPRTWASFREERECPLSSALDHNSSQPPVTDSVGTASVTPDTLISEATPVVDPKARNDTSHVDADYLSFEEWKRSHVEEEEKEELAQAKSEIHVVHAGRSISHSSTAGSANTAMPISSDNSTIEKPNAPPEPIKTVAAIPPPIHNKYNYASPDCSARIHSSSPQTQHASSLLHKSRDRYMLTPCKASEHWVVIELCDEIRVEAVEIAVWEFFSGVVRDVRVSVGGEDEDEDVGEDNGGNSSRWSEVGSFVGKNVRGVQTFTLPQATSFHRFVRLDFPSHYGTEYYCPVSLVKVFGMNQMEAFKWEQKVIAANAKEREKDRGLVKDKEAEEEQLRDRERAITQVAEKRAEEDKREKELLELEQLVQQQASRLGQGLPDFLAEAISSSTSSASIVSSAETTEMTSRVPIASATDNVTTHPTTSHRTPPKSDSSESIYAFIIRRLNALEGNSSLVARYIEEQNRVTRLMLGRAERGWDEWRKDREIEDRGRWEQDRMRQEDRFGRIFSQMEQQRLAAEHDRREMHSQLRMLADELGYERRRGLAQLFIMFVLIIVGVASRSSTIDAALKPLLAEARRRRSIYNRRSAASETGTDKAAVIDEELDVSRTKSVAKLGKRPNTPSLRHRRQVSLALPNYRSFSTSDQHIAQAGLLSPRPRVSMPPRPTSGAPPRRLAKSAHLHTLEADRVRSKMRAETRNAGEGGTTPRPGHTEMMAGPSSDANATEDAISDALTFESSGDEHSDWGTDAEGNVLSVAAVEQDLGLNNLELVKELSSIRDEKVG